MATLDSRSTSFTGSTAMPRCLSPDRLTKSSLHLNFQNVQIFKESFVSPNCGLFAPHILHSFPPAIWQDSPNNTSVLSLNFWGRTFSTVSWRLLEWAFCPLEMSKWGPKEGEWIADSHAWFRTRIQVFSYLRLQAFSFVMQPLSQRA